MSGHGSAKKRKNKGHSHHVIENTGWPKQRSPQGEISSTEVAAREYESAAAPRTERHFSPMVNDCEPCFGVKNAGYSQEVIENTRRPKQRVVPADAGDAAADGTNRCLLDRRALATQTSMCTAREVIYEGRSGSITENK
jgi:hypothetical protein